MYFIPDVGKIFTHKSADSGAFWWRGFVVEGGGGRYLSIVGERWNTKRALHFEMY